METVNNFDWASHDKGSKRCPACDRGYPHICDQCGGLLHAEQVKIPGNGFTQVTRCENCGLPEDA